MNKGAACAVAGLACVCVFCVVRLGGIALEYDIGRREYSKLEQYAPVPNDAPKEDDVQQRFQVDFEALRQMDENTVAWLYAPGTSVNYPVVQAEDNAYYLSHMFGGKKNSAGAIFMDAGCSPDFSDTHTIFYGHQMKNGTMFSDLADYLQEGYYEQHQTLALFTPQGNYAIRVFAGYVASPEDDAWQRTFASPQDFLRWCSRAAQRSAFHSDILPEEGQRVVTLSTCNDEFENARFVLVGILEPVIS